MTRYVTVKMMCAHAKKHADTVIRNLKRAGVALETIGNGYRIKESDANRFLLKHWPEVGPMGEPAKGQSAE